MHDVTDDTYLSAPQVLSRYSISDMSLYRWLKDPRKAFPKPYYIGRFRFWKVSELGLWESALPRSAPSEASFPVKKRGKS